MFMQCKSHIFIPSCCKTPHSFIRKGSILNGDMRDRTPLFHCNESPFYMACIICTAGKLTLLFCLA